jgi:hypothetical protein
LSRSLIIPESWFSSSSLKISDLLLLLGQSKPIFNPQDTRQHICDMTL